jgi:hypothetical protein
MKLTRENIHAAATKNNGFNRAQIELFGINWPPKKGWLTSLIGKEIPDDVYYKIVAMGGTKPKERKKIAEDFNDAMIGWN